MARNAWFGVALLLLTAMAAGGGEAVEAQSIEAAWGEGGLPTFKTYLKQDLQRRRQSGRQPWQNRT